MACPNTLCPPKFKQGLFLAGVHSSLSPAFHGAVWRWVCPPRPHTTHAAVCFVGYTIPTMGGLRACVGGGGLGASRTPWTGCSSSRWSALAVPPFSGARGMTLCGSTVASRPLSFEEPMTMTPGASGQRFRTMGSRDNIAYWRRQQRAPVHAKVAQGPQLVRLTKWYGDPSNAVKPRCNVQELEEPCWRLPCVGSRSDLRAPSMLYINAPSRRHEGSHRHGPHAVEACHIHPLKGVPNSMWWRVYRRADPGPTSGKCGGRSLTPSDRMMATRHACAQAPKVTGIYLLVFLSLCTRAFRVRCGT